MGILSKIFAASVLGSLVLTKRFPQYSPLASGLGTFFVLFLVQFALAAFWQVLIYPYYVSPLRHLPEPKVSITSSARAT